MTASRVVLALLVLGSGLARSQSRETGPLELVRSIPLDDVNGRIDHMAFDGAKNRLFVAALGNNSLEVVDLAAGKQAPRIERMPQAQGVRVLGSPPVIAASTGGDGKLRLFDDALKFAGVVESLPDADNVRVDDAANRIYVGYGGGALAVIDPLRKTNDLAGHPESFQLEKSGKRIFVNVPRARHVAVVDREKGSVVATWPLDKLLDNYPMALDEKNHRLFVGCRKPAKLVVMDTESGKVLAALDCCGDADDVFYDEGRGKIFVSGGAGEGMICVFERRGSDYGLLPTVTTAPGARTSLLVAETGRFYLAVPHREKQRAEIREYQVR